MTKAALFEGAAFFYGKSTRKTEETGQGKRLKRFFGRGSALRRLSMHGSGITPEDPPMPYTRDRGRGRRGSPRQGPTGEEKNEGKTAEAGDGVTRPRPAGINACRLPAVVPP